MISKKNSALIFDPKFTFPFEKHEIFGGVVHVSHMTTCEFFFLFARSGGQRDVIFHEKKYSQNSACLVKKIICLIFNKLTDLLIQATNLEARAPQIKCLGSPKAPLKFSLEYSLECGSAFCEDISKGMEILVNYPILLTYMVVI